MSSVEVWLWLLLVLGAYNPKTADILASVDGNAVDAARNIRDDKYEYLSDAIKRRAKAIRTKDVNQLINICNDNNISILTLDDPDYPELLKEIADPPIVLFVRGDISCLKGRSPIAVVGTRSCSEYSKAATRHICTELSRLGTPIISGMACGIDAEAHSACIGAGGKTVGVLACGMLVNYPAETADIRHKTIETGGALISELLPYANCRRSYFHQRNRIISGLAAGTLVAEAPPHSGSLITAQFATEQGRRVFCIPPHDIMAKNFAGVVPLLRSGAIPVYSVLDIVNEYREYGRRETLPMLRKLFDSEEKTLYPSEKTSKKTARHTLEEPPTAPTETADLENLSAEQRAIMKRLAQSPCDLDEIMDGCGLSHADATSALMELEVYGYLTRRMDGKYEI